MKENVFTGVLAALLAAGAAYLRELMVPVIVLLCVMIADYISGMARAWVTKTLSSRVGITGIVKKVGYLFVVGIGIVVDWIIQSAGTKIGIDMGGVYFVGLLVTIWLILNELISILENVSEIGAPVPEFLIKLIRRLKKTSEEKGAEGLPEENGEG
jgi:toxin secretion/phage lysis holin